MASKRVLIVDDEPAICAAIGTWLESTPGVETKAAHDAAAGLAAARSWKPHAILLDVMMPDLDGWETCRRFKADPETKDVPVFIMTAVMTKILREKTHAAGAQRLIIKPLNEQDVSKILELLESGTGRR